MRKAIVLFTLCASGLALAGIGAFAPISFDMKDPKGVSGLTIAIDGDLEPVHGFANGVSGNVLFDPTHPETASGTVVVDATSLTVGSAAMTKMMDGEFCLDTAKYPNFTFKIGKVSNVRKQKSGSYAATVTGDLTVKDVTKTITVGATATYLPNMIKKRGGMEVDGDLLIIRSGFSFNRQDFNVAPDMHYLGDVVKVELSFVGVAPKK